MTYEMIYKLLITEPNVPAMVKMADSFKKSGEDEKIVNRALSIARKDKTRKKDAVPTLNKTFFKVNQAKPTCVMPIQVEHLGDPTVEINQDGVMIL